MEPYSDLLMGWEMSKREVVVVAIVCSERNQEEQGAFKQSCPTLPIRQSRRRD